MDFKKTFPGNLLTLAVVISFTLLSLGNNSIAGTISNHPVSAVKTNDIQAKSKTKSTRVMHRAFENVGRTPGLEIWRIENFEPVPYPKNNYGKFFTGDSYIVLNTKQSKDKKTFEWDIHFWLGSETSADEAGAAAILTVQLDDILNGTPIQHREVQDHESSLFLSYFKNGVRYEKGGIGSGFKHTKTNDEGVKRLFQVKGKRNVRVRQVNLSVSSMNKGDCFILDAGSDILIYVGSQAQRVEKMKATSAANQIKDQDHHGRSKVHIIDEFSTEAEKQNFFTILGSGSPKDVPDASTAEEDTVFETTDEKCISLYKVTDQSGSLKIELLTQKPLKQEMLESSDCFVLDTCSGIFVWVGKRATQKEKSDSMKKAQEFLEAKKYPAWTEIHRIVEGSESASFKQYFSTWKDNDMIHRRLIRSTLGYFTDEIDSSANDTIVSRLIKNGGRAIRFMAEADHGNITKIIKIIENIQTGKIDKIEVTTENNVFHGSNAYIIVYEYQEKTGEKVFLVYIWEGLKSTKLIKKKSIEFGVEFGNLLPAVVVRTVQGYEPRHFCKIFKGRLMSTLSENLAAVQLYRIQGTDKNDLRANEVTLDSASLHSNDVFALVKVNDKKIYIWVGLGTLDFEKVLIEKNCKNFWPAYDIEIFEEGEEPDFFWDDLNGEGMYDRSFKYDITPSLGTRLFHCKILKKKIKFEAIQNFQQSDLDPSDLMLLDGGDEIYIWIGHEATTEEKSKFLEIAKEYIKPMGRTIDTVTIIRIQQDHEPTVFKNMFPSWENVYWDKNNV